VIKHRGFNLATLINEEEFVYMRLVLTEWNVLTASTLDVTAAIQGVYTIMFTE
jgi:hypothetical protein